LIELLIVVAIIAILAAIAVPNFLEAQTRAKIARAKEDIRTMVTALETYHIDYNKYLPAITNSDLQQHNNATSPLATTNNPAYSVMKFLSTPVSYLSSIPREGPFKAFVGFGNPMETGYNYNGGSSYTDPVGSGYRDRGVAGGYFPKSYSNTDYLIFAVGPSKIYSVKQNEGSIRKPFYVPYDATNGTVSLGDIIYARGVTDGWHSFK